MFGVQMRRRKSFKPKRLGLVVLVTVQEIDSSGQPARNGPLIPQR